MITFTKVKLPNGWLGNMSSHRVYHNNITFRTSEALFQWMRFEGYPEYQNVILEQKSPMAVKMKANRFKMLIGDEVWKRITADDINRMRTCILLKLESNPELRQKLIETHPHTIIEDVSNRNSERNRFWGAAYDGEKWVGYNNLGKIWMQIREQLITGQ